MKTLLLMVLFASPYTENDPNEMPVSVHEPDAQYVCLGIKPLCWPGQYAMCICTGPYGNNCHWVCVSS